MTFDTDTDTLSLGTATAPTSEPSHLLIERDEQTRLRLEINQLPKRDQEILTLRLSQELSYKQIAEITDLSISNVVGQPTEAKAFGSSIRLPKSILFRGGVNRVILCTDGDFDVGATGDDALDETSRSKSTSTPTKSQATA